MSDDENLPATQQRPTVVDPNNVPVVFIDWFITGGSHEGVINVALGTIDHSMIASEGDLANVIVGARLRLTQDFASRLHGALGDILGIASDDEPKKPSPSTPKNMMN
jgi:hypothetical protein